MASLRKGRGSGPDLSFGVKRSSERTTARAVLLSFLLLIAGCASLPAPTAEDVGRLNAEGARIRLEDLQVGREHYVAHCASCHALHLPAQFTREGWEKVMVRMQPKAKIDDARRDSIMTYLSVYAAQGNGPRAR